MLMRWILAGTAVGFVTFGASAALADCLITITGGGSLGKIVANTTVNGVQNAGVATTFTVPATGGSVSQSPASGPPGVAILLHPPSGIQRQVEIVSGAGCSGSIPVGFLTTTTGSPAVTPGGFTISSVSGITSLSATSVVNGGSITLTFSQTGNGRHAIINVGNAVTLPAHSSSGAAAWTIKVTAG
jgi:hypothetical protein